MEPVREQILNLQHISYTYHTLQGETLALSDISFSLKKGEFAAIVGPVSYTHLFVFEFLRDKRQSLKTPPF